MRNFVPTGNRDQSAAALLISPDSRWEPTAFFTPHLRWLNSESVYAVARTDFHSQTLPFARPELIFPAFSAHPPQRSVSPNARGRKALVINVPYLDDFSRMIKSKKNRPTDAARSDRYNHSSWEPDASLLTSFHRAIGQIPRFDVATKFQNVIVSGAQVRFAASSNACLEFNPRR